jgi:hypothetical protein
VAVREKGASRGDPARQNPQHPDPELLTTHSLRRRYIHHGCIHGETASRRSGTDRALGSGHARRVPHSARARRRRVARLRDHAGGGAVHEGRQAARPRHPVSLDPTDARRRADSGAVDRAARRVGRRPAPLLPAHGEGPGGGSRRGAAARRSRRRRAPARTARQTARPGERK